ncbi:MAG: NAD(P)/FAD-dependent oxidoreductase [Candidatus Puniceispirillaceae bacterium]
MAYHDNQDITYSLWQKTAPKAHSYDRLSSAEEVDVVIIGGGFTGLSAALHLAEAKHEVALIEAKEIGWGASGRAGGQVNPALPVKTPSELFAHYPPHFAERLAKLSIGSADFLFDLITRYHIDCDARQTGWIRALHSENALKNATLSASTWQEYGADMQLLSRDETSELTGTDAYKSAVLMPSGGLVHPLKLARGLAKIAHSKGAKLYENSPLKSLSRQSEGWCIQTEEGSISCRMVLFATNAYSGAFGNAPHIFEKQIHDCIVRASPIQIATDPLPSDIADKILPKGHSISDSRRMIMYARREPDNRIVYGSIGQRSSSGVLSGYEWLEKDARRVFTALEDVQWPYRWGGQIAITDTHLPQLIQLADGVIAGFGYNGRGVAMAHVMGSVLADYARGIPKEDLPLPLRSAKNFAFGSLKQRGLNSYITMAKWLDKWEQI